MQPASAPPGGKGVCAAVHAASLQGARCSRRSARASTTRCPSNGRFWRRSLPTRSSDPRALHSRNFGSQCMPVGRKRLASEQQSRSGSKNSAGRQRYGAGSRHFRDDAAQRQRACGARPAAAACARGGSGPAWAAPLKARPPSEPDGPFGQVSCVLSGGGEGRAGHLSSPSFSKMRGALVVFT